MDIPMGISVHCVDGPCGRTTCVIVNPVRLKVTRVVVKEAKAPRAERLVPVRLVAETTPDLIRLRCTRKELAETELFSETEFIRTEEQLLRMGYPEIGLMGYPGDDFLWLPYILPARRIVVTKREQVPPGELAVRRGARVEASDGQVGRVGEFLVDPESGHITHLVLQKGHLWGRRDVCIPIAEIDCIEERLVRLKLNKRSIESLPAIAIRGRTA